MKKPLMLEMLKPYNISLPKHLQIAVYHIFQHLISYLLHYIKAKNPALTEKLRIAVTVSTSNDELVVKVATNIESFCETILGTAFEEEKHEQYYGIKAMGERMKFYGGRLDINCGSNHQHSNITLRMPMPPVVMEE